MSKRKTVIDSLGTESFFDILDGKTFDEVIACMHEMKALYADRDVYFDVNGYGYDGGLELYLMERREETDREYEKRIAEEKRERAKKSAAARAKKEREYAEYQRLKKKFEGV